MYQKSIQQQLLPQEEHFFLFFLITVLNYCHLIILTPIYSRNHIIFTAYSECTLMVRTAAAVFFILPPVLSAVRPLRPFPAGHIDKCILLPAHRSGPSLFLLPGIHSHNSAGLPILSASERRAVRL